MADKQYLAKIPEPKIDLCRRCFNGTLCNCQINYRTNPWWSKLWKWVKRDRSFGCACIGFISCPKCGRHRGGY